MDDTQTDAGSQPTTGHVDTAHIPFTVKQALPDGVDSSDLRTRMAEVAELLNTATDMNVQNVFLVTDLPSKGYFMSDAPNFLIGVQFDSVFSRRYGAKHIKNANYALTSQFVEPDLYDHDITVPDLWHEGEGKPLDVFHGQPYYWHSPGPVMDSDDATKGSVVFLAGTSEVQGEV